MMDRRGFGKVVLGSSIAGLASACEPPVASPRVHAGFVPVTGRGARVRDVARVVPGIRTLEGAGFPVRRPFPTATLALMDPFVLLDEMGPVDWPPGQARGAPDHPHRGFETVTYVLAGGVQHRDSLGGRGLLGPGGVQWMTAGAGIVHSEMPPEAMMAQGGAMHGFQLWVNLPAREKRVAPRYQNLADRDMPTGGSDDGRVRARIIAGEALGVRARVETRTPMIYQHWTLAPGGRAQLRLPASHAAAVLVFRGGCALDDSGRIVRDGELAILGPGDLAHFAVPRTGTGPADLLVMAGVPIGEPIARRGPFVMNTDDEIREAFDDYRAGRMGVIPAG